MRISSPEIRKREELLSKQTSHIQHSEASQGPLLLEKPIQVPPTLLQDRKGDAFTWDAQSQDPSLQSPGLEPQPPVGLCQDARATQDPLRASRGNLGSVRSKESSVTSCSLEKCSNVSRLSSGYAGDEENSKVSLRGSRRIVRLKRRLNTQAAGAQISQPCATFSRSQLQSRLASQANSTTQTGGQNQASSCQSLQVDGNVQSGLKSNTSLQENETGEDMKASDQVAKGLWPPRAGATPQPLCVPDGHCHVSGIDDCHMNERMNE
ncbi:protein TNT [Equus quagga]|uniref:protein TNT n=1 Tax=Equus quagga TaxID=89248 RepID=UPI001EE1BD8D|nr:protein TNT [Equus quagga]